MANHTVYPPGSSCQNENLSAIVYFSRDGRRSAQLPVATAFAGLRTTGDE